MIELHYRRNQTSATVQWNRIRSGNVFISWLKIKLAANSCIWFVNVLIFCFDLYHMKEISAENWMDARKKNTRKSISIITFELHFNWVHWVHFQYFAIRFDLFIIRLNSAFLLTYYWTIHKMFYCLKKWNESKNWFS